MDTIKELAEVITQKRKQASLSRDELSFISGVGKTTIFDIEHGKETVQIKNILLILDALNIKVQFVNGNEP